MHRVRRAVNPTSHQTRKQRAAATRARIVAAATNLFSQRGYEATTMSEIARAAGVAVQTVHFVFHTKADLLQDAFTTAVLGDLGPPQQQDWYHALQHQTNTRRLIAAVVENVAPMVARVAPLARVIRSAPDPDVTAVWHHHEQLRRDGYREMICLLADTGRLRKGLDPDRATDIMMLILGPDTYQTLVNDFAWKPEDWITWATNTLCQQLSTDKRDTTA